MKVAVDNATLMAGVKAQIDDGYEVTLRAKGRSMAPYIRDGADDIVLKHTDKVAIGDIVLAQVTTGTFVAHRVKAIEGDRIILKGDGNLFGTETTDMAHVLAKVTHIGREGRRIDCNTPAERRRARLMHIPYYGWCMTKYVIKKMIRGVLPSKLTAAISEYRNNNKNQKK